MTFSLFYLSQQLQISLIQLVVNILLFIDRKLNLINKSILTTTIMFKFIFYQSFLLVYFSFNLV